MDSERFRTWVVFLLRLSLGCLFFYAGVSKLFDPSWTAAGYLANAQTFPELYAGLGSAPALGLVDFLNAWGLSLLGAALLTGLFVRLASVVGAALMLLYYFPVLNFPFVDHGFLVDEHIIYAFALLTLGALNAGKTWGLDAWRKPRRSKARIASR